MAEYKIIKTVAATAKDSWLRRNKIPNKVVYEIYAKFLWFWVYVDYEYGEAAAIENVEWRLGRSPDQLALQEAIEKGPEEIGRWKS